MAEESQRPEQGLESLSESQTTSARRRRLMAVLWPGFLLACVLELLVFAMADPAQLSWPGGEHLPLSADAVYSLAFVVFWLLACAGCWIAIKLATEPPPEAG